MFCNWFVILRNLVPLWKIWIKVGFTIKLAVISNLQFKARPSIVPKRTASLFATGNVPGCAVQTSQMFVFGTVSSDYSENQTSCSWFSTERESQDQLLAYIRL